MKPTLETYPTWYQEKFNLHLDGKVASVYEYVIQKLYHDIQNSNFWRELQNNLINYNDEYYLENGYSLLKVDDLKLYSKTYKSLINKSFRKNILNNNNFPNEPDGGVWVNHENWFFKIKDLLRTSITVRYLDGVEFICNKIEELAKANGFSFSADFEAREEGYYAAHITLVGKFNIVDDRWDIKEIDFPIEIQITTELQDVIKGLLHKMYEDSRILPTLDNDKKWQWDYKSKEFSSNYLGHILHYVEGMILEVRDKQNKK